MGGTTQQAAGALHRWQAGGEEKGAGRQDSPAAFPRLLSDAGSKVGVRKEALPPKAPQLLHWTQQGEPDTSALARRALRRPHSSPTQGPRVLLLPGRLPTHTHPSR